MQNLAPKEEVMLMKKVSIIIPCYNQAGYVEETVLSAINQTYQNIEIICVNDGSTDKTSEVIKKLVDKYKNIVFFDEPENKGVVAARNFAIQACTGEYILPLDADDTIEPTYVEKAVKVLDENKNIGVVYCRAKIFGAEDKIWDLPAYSKESFLYGNVVFCTALFRKSDFVKAGGYKANMEHGWEDYDLWLSFVELGLDVYQIDEILFNYRKHHNESRTDSSNKNIHKIFKQIIKNHLDLYLDNKYFIRKILTDTEGINIKKKKYKNLFNKLLLIAIGEFVAIFVLTIILLVNL